MNSNYIYNNEAIGVIAIASVMKHLQNSSIGKVMLILPLLAHNSTTNFLKKNNTNVRSIEELLTKKSGFFIGFDDRYKFLLPISLNSLLILKEMRVVYVDGGKVKYNNNANFKIDANHLGTRTKNMIIASEKLAHVMMDETENLYLQLRVKL